MDTPFEEFDVKHETTRKERSSTFMSGIHTIPKKIADIAQTQGVSEKFLDRGMPSGVINPSMFVHDRYLSMVDALQDALIITFFLVTLPLFPINLFTMIIFALILTYWFFHVAWWEKTKVWAFKGSSKKYLNHTTRVYWIVFCLLMLPSAVGLWYYIFQLGAELLTFSYINSAMAITNGIEKALADVFGNFDIVSSTLSKNPDHKITMSQSEYEHGFIIIASIFFVTTLISKFIFRIVYNKDKLENILNSQTELQYAGEAALDVIRKSRQK